MNKATPEQLERLSGEFARMHSVRLRGLLGPEILKFVAERMAKAPFRTYSHGEYGTELVAEDQVLLGLTGFLLNAPAFLELVRRISGIDEFQVFSGRIYRMLPDSGHFDEWHDDVSDGRLVGLTVNLSESPYTGGLLQFRYKSSKEIFRELANTGLGDAILFRISPQIEHHVTSVSGSVAKTACAGWFISGRPDMHSELRALAARGERDANPDAF